MTEMTALILRSAMIGFVAALAAAAAQWFITGDINPAISSGVAGAVASSMVVISNTRLPSAEQKG